jgi:predicted Zn-dependent protease
MSRTRVNAVAGLCLGVVLALSSGALSGCVTNPTTGRSQLAVLSRDEEIQMGAQYGPEFASQSGGELKEPVMNAYVTEIGTKLVQGVVDEDKSLPWKFTILNSDQINAFALPGGQVFFSLGLGRLMTNEAQLAGVLGHEIGHVTARHINERMGDQLKAQILSGVLGAAGGDAVGSLADNVAQLSLLSFGREQESEADYLGMKYMAAQGYNPIGQQQVMQILASASKSDGAPPEFLSTHPYPETRIEQIGEWLKGEFAYTQNSPQYGLFPEPFERRFLAPAAKLPPPPKPAPKQGNAGGDHQLVHSQPMNLRVMQDDAAGRVFALGDPSLWCGVCKAQKEASRE